MQQFIIDCQMTSIGALLKQFEALQPLFEIKNDKSGGWMKLPIQLNRLFCLIII